MLTAPGDVDRTERRRRGICRHLRIVGAGRDVDEPPLSLCRTHEALKSAWDIGPGMTNATVPQRIYCDNGSEFVGAAMDLWAYTNKVILDFSRRGKPTDNAAIESFNGRFREECLNVHWFASLEDAEQKIDAFRWDYNENHPHRALKGLSPNESAGRGMTTAANSPS